MRRLVAGTQERQVVSDESHEVCFTAPSLSTFSFMDGFGMPADHVAQTAALGGWAQATTEHGNISSHAKHEQACVKMGIKPLFGVEAYTASEQTKRKWHLTVLAQDEVGYRNLTELVTESWLPDNFYQWPTMTTGMIAAHSNGLVVLSGCSSSELACALFGGKGNDEASLGNPDWLAARRVASRLRDTFGDRFYLEVQIFPELDRTRALNVAYEKLGRELGIPLAATCDVHYPVAGDSEMQKILHTAGRGLGTVENAEEQWEYDIPLTVPLTDRIIVERLVASGLSLEAARDACRSTVDIAHRCTVQLPKAPKFRYPGREKAETLIWDWLRRGWKYRSQRGGLRHASRAQYEERLRYEMSIISDKDFIDYFLMLSDIVRWAKNRGIAFGPGRGSAAASLVAYLLRITEIDPLQFPAMMFERFMDPNRFDYPDVDLDIDDVRRKEVLEYVRKKYGERNVALVANFGRYRGRNSLDDVGRAHGIAPWILKPLKDMIIDRPEGDARFANSIEDTFGLFPAARAIVDENPSLQYATKLEGNLKNLGQHAGGVVLSTRPISDVTATYMRERKADKEMVNLLAYDKWDAEYVGMIKMDFLGLSTMGAIGDALTMVDMSLDELYALPLDDSATLEAFKTGDVIGVFQWDGATNRRLNARVQPDTFMELADITALTRPGALLSGASEAYIKAKFDPEAVVELHPMVSKLTRETHGQIVYQEQVLGIIRDIGNFSPADVGKIRKIIGKKQGAEQFDKLRDDFVAGANTHGIDAALAQRIWNFLIASAGYSFNIAHSVAYALLSYWTMWFKVHHPIAFYCSMLRKREDLPEWQRLIKDARVHGVNVVGPSWDSGTTWEIHDGFVQAGWSQLNGVGKKSAPVIVAAPHSNPKELLAIKGIGKVTVEKVTAAFCNDDFFEIDSIESELRALRAQAASEGWKMTPDTTSADLEENDGHWVNVAGYVREIKVLDAVEEEKKFTGRPIEEILQDFKDPHLRKKAKITIFDEGSVDVKIGFNRWNYPKLEEVIDGLSVGDLVIVGGKVNSGTFLSVAGNKILALDAD